MNYSASREAGDSVDAAAFGAEPFRAAPSVAAPPDDSPCAAPAPGAAPSPSVDEVTDGEAAPEARDEAPPDARSWILRSSSCVSTTAARSAARAARYSFSAASMLPLAW